MAVVVMAVAAHEDGAFNRAMNGNYHLQDDMKSAELELAARRKKYFPIDPGFGIYTWVVIPYLPARSVQLSSGLFEGEEE